jgi:hypothetical protein
LWERVQADAMRLAYNSPPAVSPNPSQCTLIEQDGRNKDAAEFALAQSVTAFVREWGVAVEHDTAKTATFGPTERLRVADTVGSFFYGLSDVPAAGRPAVDSFVDPAKFATLITDSAFPGQVRDHALKMAPDTCDELVGSRLASRVPPPA